MLTRFDWRDATGVQTILSDPTRDHLDPRGRFSAVTLPMNMGAPPRSFISYPVPGLAGTVRQATVVGARDFALKVTLVAPEVALFVEEWLGRFLAGPGTLVTYRDSSIRMIDCEYSSGLEDPTWTSPASADAVIAFHADQPYFYGPAAPTLTLAAGPAPSFYPFLPLSLGQGGLTASNTAYNIGDVPAYGTWTVTGPGGPFVLSDGRGRSFGWDGTLAVGEVLAIDTDPREQTVTDGTGADRYSQIDPVNFDLWPLSPGPTTVGIQVASPGPTSTVSLAYAPAYSSCL